MFVFAKSISKNRITEESSPYPLPRFSNPEYGIDCAFLRALELT